MLVEGQAVRYRWAEYFDELLNVQDGVQARVLAAAGYRMMPVFDKLNDRWVESYEVEEGMSKMNRGKAPGLDQCAGDFLLITDCSIVVSNDCSIVVLRLGKFHGTSVRHVLTRSMKDKGTSASALTPGT